MHTSRLFFAVVSLAFCGAVFAQQPYRLPTHCKTNEFAYLNARLSKVQKLEGGGYKLLKTDKLLSLCADQKQEPFQSVTYRYGSAGAPEMERTATPGSKFGIFSRSTTPHTGENMVFFTAGAFTYCVSEATGQGSGIGLTVLKSGKKVVDLFSGNDQGGDFESEMIEIDFDSAQSPVFKLEKKADRFHTVCDARPAP